MKHYHVYKFVDQFFQSGKQDIKAHYFITEPQ